MNDSLVEKQRRHFNAIADEYAAARSHRNCLALKSLMWREFLAPRVSSLPQRPRVLEAMCGFADGWSIFERLLDCRIDYTGFDYSDVVVELLRERQPGIGVYQQDVTSFEPDQAYDVVLCLGGLHHVPHAARDVAARLARAVRKGGYLVSWEPTSGNSLFRRIRERIYRSNVVFDTETERAFEVDELRALFEDAGLRAVDVCYPGLLSYVLYYNPDAFPRLNLGSPGTVRALWRLERPFIRARFARFMSFATLSLWQR